MPHGSLRRLLPMLGAVLLILSACAPGFSASSSLPRPHVIQNTPTPLPPGGDPPGDETLALI